MIASENDISFLEALEVIKMINSTLDDVLREIASEIRNLKYEISDLKFDK